MAVATIPTIFYYSSITYLEMPAVMLMTIVCLRIEPLARNDTSAIKQDVGWYALILLGFIKETTLPFILMFLAYRSFYLLLEYFKTRDNDNKAIKNNEPIKKNHFLKKLTGEFTVVAAT